MFDLSALRGKISEVCGTRAVFSSRMGWSERTMSLKINGSIEWKQSEIIKACEILNISISAIHLYFFKTSVQN